MIKYLNNKRKKGQSTLEYAILIIIIIGALLSIQIYIRRGIQGRFKSSTDDIGDQFSVGNTNVVETTTTKSRVNIRNIQSGQAETMIVPEQTNTLVNSEVMNLEYEYWG